MWEGEGGGGGGPATVTATAADDDKKAKKAAAQEYNSRRAEYRRQVSALRRRYADEVAAQRAADKAEQEALARELTRRRLERQYRKNLRSARNALLQERRRQERAREFQQHLERMQQKREAENELSLKARQLVVDELEKEAPLWLTTHEEVESAFTPEAEQLLWARPGGIIGAPNPNLDSHFWHLETHTWHMDRTYPSQRDVLLERLEEMAYEEANVDPAVWTPERVEERRRLEERARLRAMVQSAGRAELLRRQRQMLLSEDSSSSVTDGGIKIPKSAPVPSLQMLGDREALEREGSALLMEDPTKFFVFEGAKAGTAFSDSEGEGDAANESDFHDASKEYSGPSLGSPIRLRDPLRDSNNGSYQSSVYPTIIGRISPADTRTEREKKKQEREERMWAAAQADKIRQSSGDGGDGDIELAAQQRTLDDLEPDIDYDNLEWDWQEEEWKKGLDPVADAALLNIPREERYTEEDIEWVASQLDAKVKHLEQQLKYDLDNLRHSLASGSAKGRGKSSDESLTEGGSSLEAALLALSDRELLELSDLDDRYSEGTMTEQEIRDAATESIKGLSQDQVWALLQRDRTAENS